MALVASYTHALALLISDDSSNQDNSTLPLCIDAECFVSEGKVEQVKAGYEQLKSLQSSNLDVSISSIDGFSVDNPSIGDSLCSSILRLRPRRSSTVYNTSRKSTRTRSSSKPYTNKSQR